MVVSRTRVKFCGIRRKVDAEVAVGLGVDALGFVLVPASKRYVDVERAAAICTSLPPFVATVALFMNPSRSQVRDAIRLMRPDWLQFHGSEPAVFCESFGLPYIKAVAMDGQVSLRRLAREYSSARSLLLDSHAPGGMGGQGRTFDWKSVGATRKPLVLAGGLRADNVAEGIRMLRPFAVDVSSGIEVRPGIKDPAKMRAFVDAVRRADEK